MSFPVTCYVTAPDVDDVTDGRLFLNGEPDETHPGMTAIGRYQIINVGPGSVAWRVYSAKSPYQHGEFQTNAVKESPVAPLSVLVEGQTLDELEVNTDLLLRCFEQFTYELHFGLTSGAFWVWRCHQADYRPNDDGTFRASHMREFVQVYTFQVRRDPIPLAGSQ